MSIFTDLNKIILEADVAPPEGVAPQEADKGTPTDKDKPVGVDGNSEDVKYDNFEVHFADIKDPAPNAPSDTPNFKKDIMEALQAKLNFATTDKRALDIINKQLSTIPLYSGSIDEFIQKYQIKL